MPKKGGLPEGGEEKNWVREGGGGGGVQGKKVKGSVEIMYVLGGW